MGLRRLHKRKIIYLILPLILSACYTYSKGPFVSSDEVPTSKQIISKEYKTTLISKPAPRNPVLTLKIEEKAKYRVQVIPKYRKVKKPLNGINYGIPLIALSSTIKNEKTKILIVTILSLWMLADLIELANSSQYSASKNQFIYSNPQYVIKETDFYPADNSYIDVIVSTYGKKLQRKILSGYNGLAQINFYDFFPDHKFNSDKDQIEVSIQKDNTTISKFNFYSSEISTLYAEIKIDKVLILETPSGNAKKLYEASKGESFPVVFVSKDWVQVEFQDNKTGWIPYISVNITRKIYRKK